MEGSAATEVCVQLPNVKDPSKINDFVSSLLTENHADDKITIKVDISFEDLDILLTFLGTTCTCFRKIKPLGGNRGLWPTAWYLDLTITISNSHTLDSIPQEVWIIPQIERLKLSGGKQDTDFSVSPFIGFQKSLVYFEAYNCHLERLPTSLHACTNLKEFHICCNKFRALPGFLNDLEQLEKISREGNDFDFNTSNKCRSIFRRTEQDKSVPSLKQLASAKVEELMLQQPECAFDILYKLPQHLLYTMGEDLLYTYICKACKRIFREGHGYQVFSIRESMNGYTYLLFEDHACSNQCIEDTFNWYKDNGYSMETTVQVYFFPENIKPRRVPRWAQFREWCKKALFCGRS